MKIASHLIQHTAQQPDGPASYSIFSSFKKPTFPVLSRLCQKDGLQVLRSHSKRAFGDIGSELSRLKVNKSDNFETKLTKVYLAVVIGYASAVTAGILPAAVAANMIKHSIRDELSKQNMPTA